MEATLTVQDYLSHLVTGKSVLDVGCADHAAESEAQDTWLHKHIRGSAASVVGLDYSKEAVEELNRRGYHIICADAMTADLGQQFDVITAGEIIEHVENPGAMLRNLARHLNPGGRLVVTTPNVWFAFHFVESLFFEPHKRWNYEHVAWYCSFTLCNLLQRCGLRVKAIRYMARSRKTRSVLRTFGLSCPKWLSSTLVVVATKDD